METFSFKVSDSLHLVRLDLHKTQEPTSLIETPTNHVCIIDCSGSMSWDLPHIREQLKRKLPKMVGVRDTVSLIWFSGSGQFGVLLEGEPVATLIDLNDVNKAIDRWLMPVGLTGFKEPLEECARLIDRLDKRIPGSAFSVMFMSDGCDNQWNRSEILKAMEAACKNAAALTIVEYGFYADRPTLTAMAEKAGGTLIFAEDFDRYAPQFEAIMGKRPTPGKRIEVEIPENVIGGFVFTMADGDLLTFTANANKALVPENTGTLWALTPKAEGKATPLDVSAAYAALSLYSVRMMPEVMLPLLRALGDVRLVKDFGGCFGKQRYSAFMEAAREAAFDPTQRLTQGHDPNCVPADDAFTVLDLLQILADDENNHVLLDHPDFKYNRIGRGRSEIAQETLKFETDPMPDGYSINNLVLNETRPNISIQVRRTGTVDLTTRLKDGEHPMIPRKFPTFVYRNYTIVKDGLVNISQLPVQVTPETYAKLVDAGIVARADALGPVDLTLDLSRLPVINRSMVKTISAKTLFETEYALAKARGAQKVYNTIKKDKFPRKSLGYETLYGAYAATWLKEQGLTDYSGYQPPLTKLNEARDFYMGKELTISLKGLSSLPSLKKAEEALAKGRVTASVALMEPAIQEVSDFLASQVYAKAKDQDKLFEAWLNGQLKSAQADARHLLSEMARMCFSIIVGQTWIFPTIDENSLEITTNDGSPLACKAELREIKIEI